MRRIIDINNYIEGGKYYKFMGVNGIMHGKSIFKAGKLVKIDLEYENDAIVKIKIEGDFFLYPEEGREKLERALTGVKLDKEMIRNRVDETLTKEKLEVYGFTSEQLADAIIQAHQPIATS